MVEVMASFASFEEEELGEEEKERIKFALAIAIIKEKYKRLLLDGRLENVAQRQALKSRVDRGDESQLSVSGSQHEENEADALKLPQLPCCASSTFATLSTVAKLQRLCTKGKSLVLSVGSSSITPCVVSELKIGIQAMRFLLLELLKLTDRQISNSLPTFKQAGGLFTAFLKCLSETGLLEQKELFEEVKTILTALVTTIKDWSWNQFTTKEDRRNLLMQLVVEMASSGSVGVSALVILCSCAKEMSDLLMKDEDFRDGFEQVIDNAFYILRCIEMVLFILLTTEASHALSSGSNMQTSIAQVTSLTPVALQLSSTWPMLSAYLLRIIARAESFSAPQK